jgi:hypothetical protein
LIKFLKSRLPLMPTAMTARDGLTPLGRIKGEHGPRLVAISTDRGLDLAIGSEVLPVAELIFFRDGQLKIDIDEVHRLADRDQEATHESYVPSTNKRGRRKAETADRHQYWKEEYRRMKRTHPNWSDEAISQTIAENDPFAEKRAAETVRRYMK